MPEWISEFLQTVANYSSWVQKRQFEKSREVENLPIPGQTNKGRSSDKMLNILTNPANLRQSVQSSEKTLVLKRFYLEPVFGVFSG